MRIVQVATALVATLVLVSCEPVTEPATDLSFDPPAPSFAIFNPVVEQVTGSAIFHHTLGGETHLRRQTFTVRRVADGSVVGEFTGVFRNRYVLFPHCFTVRGNEAWIGLYNVYGGERFVYVVDNGEGAGTPPDRATSSPRLGLLGDPPDGYDEWNLDVLCAATPDVPERLVYDLEAGNVQILSVRPSVPHVLFDQAPADEGVNYAAVHYADDFVLPVSATLQEFRWWGSTGAGVTTAVRLFSDDGTGSPEVDPFFELINPAVHSALSSVIPRVPTLPVYENLVELSNAPVLQAGTRYYVSISGPAFWLSSTALGSEWWYRVSETDAWTNASTTNPSNLAFQLVGIPRR